MKLNRKAIAILVGAFLLFNSCKEDDDQVWLIPSDEIKDGGPGKDGIPSLDNPLMINAGDVSYLNDSDLVVGYKNGNDVKAYSHKIFNWHEIVNDKIGGKPIAITHCPLTGTSIGWDRVLNGQVTTFGVSGLLYNTNLMPYDRATNSTWTQQGLKCVSGKLIGSKPKTIQVFETKWGTWKQMYPDSKVVSDNTNFGRNYQQYPYGSYRTTPGLIFSVSVNDDRLPQKERVHGVIINDRVKVYRFDSFSNNPVIKDSFQGEEIVVVGSKGKNFIVSFKSKIIGGETLIFSKTNNFSANEILEDQFGNTWDVFGNAITGPDTGAKLEATTSFIGMWFSWAPFYANPEIYGN